MSSRLKLPKRECGGSQPPRKQLKEKKRKKKKRLGLKACCCSRLLVKNKGKQQASGKYRGKKELKSGREQNREQRPNEDFLPALAEIKKTNREEYVVFILSQSRYKWAAL